MYKRKVVLFADDKGNTPLDAFIGSGDLSFPKVFMTAENIRTFWNNTPGSTSFVDLVSILVDWGVKCYIDFYNPGIGSGDIRESSFYSTAKILLTGASIQQTITTSKSCYYLSNAAQSVTDIYNSGDGFICRGASGIAFRKDGVRTSLYSSSYPTLLGYNHISGSTSVLAWVCFFSADEQFCICRLSGNKNNSYLKVCDENISADIYEWYTSLEEVDEDPYGPTPGSGTAGGDGSHSLTGDDIDYAPLPSVSGSATGFLTMLNPTQYQIQSLANFMWSSLFDIDTLKRLFADPMDVILGLSLVPGPIVDTGVINLAIGGISTGLSMVTCNQFYSVDCGSVTIDEFYGAYLDYFPYTKVELFLPYIGSVPLDPNEVMGKTVGVRYNIDALTGAVIAMVKVGGSVLYNFTGSCSTNIPITSRDWTETINAIANVAAMVAGAAMGLPIAGAGVAPSLSESAKKNVQYHNELAEARTAYGASGDVIKSFNGSFQHSGPCSTTPGLMGIQTPYLTITIPNMCRPAYQNRLIGYPSYITEVLSTLVGTGYTRIADIHLEGIPASETELDELLSILKGGVIL